MVLLSDSVEGSSCSSTDGLRYEVFLNFRGKDTRKNFTDHLHKALKDSNIKTFLDEEEIETGDFLKPELERAIKASRASILLLSKNYADSAWCLDELVLILQQQKMSGGRKHFAIPIFYHVEPGDVRLHTSTFGDAIAKHRKYLEAETDSDKRSKFAKRIEGWVTALTEVADMDKIDVKLRPETEVIDDIIDRIYGRLHVPLRAATPKPLGMENSIKFVTTWLENPSSNRGDVLAILGMGGIGKTSLAEYIYELRCRTFRTSSFIKDISRKCATKSEELAVLAKQLCGDITRKRSTEVYDIATYTSNIQNAVTNKKVFIVLDDISSLAQLNALLGKKHFHEESKIIITTRDASLTKNCDLLINAEVAPTYKQLKLECLDDTMSRELFFHHAFGSEKPMPKIEKLSEEFLKYCRGHPLSLEVWGKKLHPCREKVDHWNDYIKGLKTEMLPCIKKDLEMSFDSLQSDSDQHLFKHIACFFVGIDRSFSETILEACKLQVITGIENLTDKYLLSIGCNKELVMHPLIQEMGRFLVREESKRTRYWCHDESSNVLTKNKGTENILGLTLDAKMLKNKRLKGKFKIETNALSIMDRLQLLQLNYVKIDGPYENFPEELRWLCMHSFCSESIPTTLQMEFRLQMEFLVVLDLSHSDIKSFGILGENAPPPPETQEESIASCSEDITLPESLKILNLSHCRNLLSVGGFDQLKALERLTVTYCKSLVNVADTITTCSNLVFVDMTYCNMSEELRRTRDMLDHVKTVLA